MKATTKNQIRNLNNEVQKIQELQKNYLSTSIFLAELKERFDILNQVEEPGLHANELISIKKLVLEQIDGLIKPSRELSDLNFTVNTVIEKLNYQRHNLLD
jgi:hypothetical protein